MEMIERQVGSATILKLSGRFDAYVAPLVEKFFQRIDPNSEPHVIINLAEVNFIDSMSIAALIIGMKKCQRQKGEMIICSVQQTVRIIFELTRLDKVFTMCSTQEEAVEKVEKRAEV